MPPFMSIRIHVHHGIIAAVCKQVKPVDISRLDIAYVVRVDKPANGRVIVAAVQVVKTGFGIVVIPAVAERIELCYRIIIR